jgi:hypothetical protein
VRDDLVSWRTPRTLIKHLLILMILYLGSIIPFNIGSCTNVLAVSKSRKDAS